MKKIFFLTLISLSAFSQYSSKKELETQTYKNKLIGIESNFWVDKYTFNNGKRGLFKLQRTIKDEKAYSAQKILNQMYAIQGVGLLTSTLGLIVGLKEINKLPCKPTKPKNFDCNSFLKPSNLIYFASFGLQFAVVNKKREAAEEYNYFINKKYKKK